MTSGDGTLSNSQVILEENLFVKPPVGPLLQRKISLPLLSVGGVSVDNIICSVSAKSDLAGGKYQCPFWTASATEALSGILSCLGSVEQKRENKGPRSVQ